MVRFSKLARTVAVVVSLAGLLALAGCSGAPSSPASGSTGSTTVVLKNYQFSPQNVTVRPGDTVTFQNQDTVPHHVVVGTTDLGVQQPGATATWASGSDETLTLKCLFHASMVGQITVGNGGSGAPTGGTPPSSGGSSGGYAPPPAGGYGY